MKSAGRARPAEKGLSGIRHKNETQPFATKMRQSETGRSGRSRFATRFETRHSLSVLKVRGEISHQLANGGEFATSRRNRWIGSVSDGRETSRSVTVAGDLSGALPSQNRRVTGISIVGRISPGITSSHSIDEGRAAAPDW